ncbi:MAG: leucine--tRNA ligase [Ruminococcaceae bacterium]|nr:leucine--tRNA ligase [Oscillospiraceae bacterium]
MKYNFEKIEKKWQEIWNKEGTFNAKKNCALPKYYVLIEFPYPSGEGLHIGHPRPYTAMDIVARKKRLEGYNVLYPIGWDAFGLPTENYAMQNKIHPAVVTRDNIKRFKSQLMSLGLSFDWSREINTTDPSYYKWTQWIFLKMFEKGLAYKKEMAVNYCTSCKVVLANEEVIAGSCERCHSEVVRKIKSQWMLAITKYADRLIDDLDTVDYIDRVKSQQINWIGRSYGAEIVFPTSKGDNLVVYTTRPDTIFGATYMVISPEHELLEKWSDSIENYDEIVQYRYLASKKSDLERTELSKEKTGVEILGVSAVNPATGKKIPIFVADYVLMGYGTGAIMAVPGHDQRDYDFAKKFSLPIIEVVEGGDIEREAYVDCDKGLMVNSGFLNGLNVEQAKTKTVEWLMENGIGGNKVNYKLRDWVFSRQRFWGEPIPIIICDKCGYVPLKDSDLPLMLPELEDYEPGHEGESPLSRAEDWVNVSCPICGRAAKRETDTMPQWAGSSWYYLRYCDAGNENFLASKEELDYWMAVDWYNGGMEHTTLHLLYSRFWHKFLYDIGVTSQPEPYLKRTSHGMILGDDGQKMSKSRGNVINPDEVVKEYGADTLRLYEMFIGDFEKTAPWSSESIKGCKRFLDRVFDMVGFVVDGKDYSKDLEVLFHKTVKKVGEDIENMKFNTAIATLMTLTNEIYANKRLNKFEFEIFLTLLNPFAPHITEELWQMIGNKSMISAAEWPKYNPEKCQEDSIEIAVQVNGKVRGRITIDVDAEESEVLETARSNQQICEMIKGKTLIKELYVKGKIVNFVVK